jgi:hypothetical protein
MVMETMLEELRRLTNPTIEEFVDAVIHTHERNRVNLLALSQGAAGPDFDDAAEDADIIRTYCLSYGVWSRQSRETGPVEPRWLAG